MLQFSKYDTFINKAEPDQLVTIDEKHPHGYELSSGEFITSDDALLSRFEPLAQFAAPIPQVHVVEEGTDSSKLRVQTAADLKFDKDTTYVLDASFEHTPREYDSDKTDNVEVAQDIAKPLASPLAQAFEKLNDVSYKGDGIEIKVNVDGLMPLDKIRQFAELYSAEDEQLEECILHILDQHNTREAILKKLAQSILDNL